MRFDFIENKIPPQSAGDLFVGWRMPGRFSDEMPDGLNGFYNRLGGGHFDFHNRVSPAYDECRVFFNQAFSNKEFFKIIIYRKF